MATQNRRELALFKIAAPADRLLKLSPQETSALVRFANNKSQYVEFPWGNTFLSQNSRTWLMPGRYQSIELSDRQGHSTRKLVFPKQVP